MKQFQHKNTYVPNPRKLCDFALPITILPVEWDADESRDMEAIKQLSCAEQADLELKWREPEWKSRFKNYEVKFIAKENLN